MKINSTIADAYCDGKRVADYSKLWIFHSGQIAYSEPSYEPKKLEFVKNICSQIKKAVEEFVPANADIWDILFFDWQKIVENADIDLIVGFPQPYDATVLKNPENGKKHIVFDVGLWTAYAGRCDIASVVHNLLTHELCHVCISVLVQTIDEDIISNDYLTNLDANTFHEGFAHLVSCNDKEISAVDWHSDIFTSVRKKSRERMLRALSEQDESTKNKYLYEACCGNYYDKFACMCGMLYLADCWETGGVSGLKKEFEKGYIGFAKRTVYM
jgi:hypothetical protein